MRLGLGLGIGSGGSPATPSDPVADFLSLISGSAQSGFFDGREATGSGATFALADQNGGAGFTSGINLDPTISGTLGLVYADETTQITRAQSAGNYSVLLRLTKNAGHGDVSAKFLLGNVGIYEGDNAVSNTGITTFVDGASVANRQAFYNAINSGAATVMFTGSSAVPILIGRNGLSFLGSILGIAVIAEADFPSTLADVQAAARSALEAL